eukprot:SAG11_NODE_710_length_7643_cov_26.058177_4_plen_183_part_00
MTHLRLHSHLIQFTFYYVNIFFKITFLSRPPLHYVITSLTVTRPERFYIAEFILYGGCGNFLNCPRTAPFPSTRAPVSLSVLALLSSPCLCLSLHACLSLSVPLSVPLSLSLSLSVPVSLSACPCLSLRVCVSLRARCLSLRVKISICAAGRWKTTMPRVAEVPVSLDTINLFYFLLGTLPF